MAVVAQYWAEQERLAGGGIVATIMSNLGLERYLDSIGLDMVRTPVGDRYVVEHMRQHGYNVGGEQSGHIVLSDFTTTGDGLVAALQVLAVVKQSGKPVSEVCHRFEPLPQLMRNVRYSGASPLEAEAVTRAIAGANERLDGVGRLVVRASGTEPVIRVMAEGEDPDLVESTVGELAEVIGKAN